MGSGMPPNTTTAHSGPLTNQSKTPKGMLTNRAEPSKLFTPVAQSPNNNKHSGSGSASKNKGQFFRPEDEQLYHPGMLRVSPNSGFTQFKKPYGTNDEPKNGKGSQEN